MISLVEIKNGWLAISQQPRLAGYGPTPMHAQESLSWLLATFQAAIEAQEKPS